MYVRVCAKIFALKPGPASGIRENDQGVLLMGCGRALGQEILDGKKEVRLGSSLGLVVVCRMQMSVSPMFLTTTW